MSSAQTATWYFDLLSPFSYLQLHRMEEIRARIEVTPVPVVLGAILAHWEQRGPAEIEPKRLHTYRMALWRAAQLGVPMRFPPAHPFNSLAGLRLVVALGSRWDAVSTLFDAVFREGRDVGDPGEIERLGRALGLADPAAAIADPKVKDRLRRNTEEAIAAGVFGVPTLIAGGEIFWGEDAQPMLDAWLDDRALFDKGEMARLADLPVGVKRRATGG